MSIISKWIFKKRHPLSWKHNKGNCDNFMPPKCDNLDKMHKFLERHKLQDKNIQSCHFFFTLLEVLGQLGKKLKQNASRSEMKK